MKYKLSEIMDIIGGGTPKTSKSEYWDGDIPWLSVKDFNNDYRYVYETEKTITKAGLDNSSTKMLKRNDSIISARGTVGEIAMIPFPTAFNQSCYGLRAKEGIVDAEYLYYLIKHNVVVLKKNTHGSVFDTITRDTFDGIEVDLPSLEEQKKVASILRDYDDKIEVNNEINKNLEQQAMALFRAWFIDYSPFQGQIPSDWKKYKLGEFLPVITGKKNVNVSSDHGEYPFFSCSQDIAWTDEYSFEGNAILVAGNGDFNVKFYSGKFEAYQRTYVLIPYNPRFTAWLFYAVKHNLDLITVAARGSVIKFITKGNLEDFAFHAPVDLDNCAIIDHFTAINNQIAENRTENSKLAELRNALLPRLMSGELDVSDIDL